MDGRAFGLLVGLSYGNREKTAVDGYSLYHKKGRKPAAYHNILGIISLVLGEKRWYDCPRMSVGGWQWKGYWISYGQGIGGRSITMAFMNIGRPAWME